MQYVTVLQGKELAEKLDRPTILILFYLEKGSAYIRELSSELNMSNTTVYNALLTLVQLGLISEKRERGKRVIYLTDKGKKVVSKLKELDKLIRETL